MKKILIAIPLTVCLLSLMGVCWADSQEYIDDESTVIAEYVTASKVSTEFEISGKTATCAFAILLKPSQDVDYTKITVHIKKDNGTAVKTFNAQIKPSIGRIIWKDSAKLSSKGTYFITCIAKCYKNGKCIETISGRSSNKTY